MLGFLLKSIDRRIACIIAAAFLCLGQAAAQKADPALYGALPNVSEVQVSPNGRYLALLQNINGVGAVIFYDLDEPGNGPTGVNLGSYDGRGITWANNETILLLVSQSKTLATTSGLQAIEFFRWMSVSRTKGSAELLFGNEAGYFMGEAGAFLGIKAEDNNRAIFARSSVQNDTRGNASRLRKGDEFSYSLYEVNLKNGRQRIIEKGNPSTVDWVIDEFGEPVVRVDYDEKAEKRNIYIRQNGEKRLRLIKEVGEKRSDDYILSFQGLSAKPGIALITASNKYGRSALFEFVLATGEVGNAVFSNKEYDLDDVNYDPRSARVTSVSYIEDLPKTFHLNTDDQSLQNQLAQALQDATPKIVSKSDDGSRMVVEAIYTDHPSRFFVYDKNARNLNMLASSYNSLDGRIAAKKEIYNYTASDGMVIPGYLTVPSGADKSNMPLIVLPHGGPWSRDDQAFDWWSFFYAARGYLVYQPNFRGSSGYGYNFRMAGNGEWGRRMQADITEGIEALSADGMVDPERVCIVGASYGGYAALAGATITPTRYKCAVSVNGVSNILQLLADAGDRDYWEKRVGNRFRDEDSLRGASPAYIVSERTPPVMLIHGTDDTVVPFGQSQLMQKALEEKRVPHEFITLEDEDHWLSTGPMRTKMLTESIRFIDQHIGD